jgi:hypothetical protein
MRKDDMMNELNVKVGDKVLVSSYSTEYIATVVKITPTGRIRTDKTGNTQFDKYGDQMGGDSIWHRSHISLLTDNDITRLKGLAVKRKAFNLMQSFSIDTITVEQAEKIIAILDGRKENK